MIKLREEAGEKYPRGRQPGNETAGGWTQRSLDPKEG